VSRDDPDNLKRLEKLGSRLDEIKRREQKAERARTGSLERTEGLSVGLRIGVELVAAIAVGTGLGYALDRLLGSLPIALLVGFTLGSAAGMVNVVRTAKELDRRSRERRAADDRTVK